MKSFAKIKLFNGLITYLSVQNYQTHYLMHKLVGCDREINPDELIKYIAKMMESDRTVNKS